MRCKVCGAEYREGSRFCGSCGAPLAEGGTPGSAPRPGSPQGRAPQGGNVYGNAADFHGEYAGRKPKKKHHYGIIGIVAAVVILAAVAVFFIVRGLGGSSYEKVVEKAINSVFDGDIKALVDLLPPDMLDYAMEQEGISQSELDSQIDQMGDMLKTEMKSLSTEYGDDWKISQKILSETDVTGADLEDLQDDYSELNVKVTAAKKLI